MVADCDEHIRRPGADGLSPIETGLPMYVDLRLRMEYIKHTPKVHVIFGYRSVDGSTRVRPNPARKVVREAARNAKLN
jgi:hypothetical protein